PSTSAPDAEKACVSSPQPPKKDCSDHDNQQKPQFDDTSNECSTIRDTVARSASKSSWISSRVLEIMFEYYGWPPTKSPRRNH
ncbi:MAG TPA: hypothetical protein VED43_08300, partial [Mycobacterium sp.]|nr:hypothetical protein [Mycobacterium sp.]